MTPIEGATSDWIEHAFTAKLRKHLQEQHVLALKKLVSSCRKSEDPLVARDYASYEAIGDFLTQLGKVNSHGSYDGDDD